MSGAEKHEGLDPADTGDPRRTSLTAAEAKQVREQLEKQGVPHGEAEKAVDEVWQQVGPENAFAAAKAWGLGHLRRRSR